MGSMGMGEGEIGMGSTVIHCVSPWPAELWILLVFCTFY